MGLLEVAIHTLLNKAASGNGAALKLALEFSKEAHAVLSKTGEEQVQTEDGFSWTDEMEELCQQLAASASPETESS
jgi:hypothetical protein